jgi:LacI family transcriptional regulator
MSSARSNQTRTRRAEPTVRDVAVRANVALSSASRVFTGHPNVSPSMRLRVLAAAEELGYEPDLIARSLRTGRSQSLGFLVTDLANPIFADMIRGAEDYVRSLGFGLLITDSEGDAKLDAEKLQMFVRRRVDGIMLLTAHVGADEGIVEDQLSLASVPLVVLDRDVSRGSTASTVYNDYGYGTALAVSHLLERGHRGIGFISGPAQLRAVHDRMIAFETAYRHASLSWDTSLARLGSLAPRFGFDETLKLLDDPSPPSALLVGGNRLLTGVLEALHSRNVIVGRDIALVSCDDVDLTRLYRPPISVIARDTYAMGQTAAELLVERILEPASLPRSVLLPTWFVARESTAFDWTPGLIAGTRGRRLEVPQPQ